MVSLGDKVTVQRKHRTLLKVSLPCFWSEEISMQSDVKRDVCDPIFSVR